MAVTVTAGFLLASLSGCGGGAGGGGATGTSAPVSQAATQPGAALNLNFAGTNWPAGTNSVSVQGFDSSGSSTYGPVTAPLPANENVVLDVPVTTTSIDVNAVDSAGNTLEILSSSGLNLNASKPNTLSGGQFAVRDVAVTLTSPNGPVTVPASTLSDSTQRSIMVNVTYSNGTTGVLPLYQALNTSSLSITSLH
ncbi:MAG: hypothetical protein ACYCW6_06700 [Candidatus Xenobia bacterium]